MRVVLDTNILVSALIVPHGTPDLLYQAWRAGRFVLVTSEEQLDEFRRVTRYPKIRSYIQPALAGTMYNEIRQLAVVIDKLPQIDILRDPADNFLLAMALAEKAHYLVSGDKRDVLKLRRYGPTKIISVKQFTKFLS